MSCKCYSYGDVTGLSWDEVMEMAVKDAEHLDDRADGGEHIPSWWFDKAVRYVGQNRYDRGEIYDYRDTTQELYGEKTVRVPSLAEIIDKEVA